jgi:hypothetical protein
MEWLFIQEDWKIINIRFGTYFVIEPNPNTAAITYRIMFYGSLGKFFDHQGNLAGSSHKIREGSFQHCRRVMDLLTESLDPNRVPQPVNEEVAEKRRQLIIELGRLKANDEDVPYPGWLYLQSLRFF